MRHYLLHHLLIVDGDPSALSPYQVKAAPHWLRHYLFNGYRRLSGELFFFGVPFVLGMSPFLLPWYHDGDPVH